MIITNYSYQLYQIPLDKLIQHGKYFAIAAEISTFNFRSISFQVLIEIP